MHESKNYLLTYGAIRAKYPRLHPEGAAKIAAEIAKRGLSHVDPATGQVAFDAAVADLAPRLVAAPVVTDQMSEAQKLAVAVEIMRRSEHTPPKERTAKGALPEFEIAKPLAEQLRADNSEESRLFNAVLLMQRYEAAQESRDE